MFNDLLKIFSEQASLLTSIVSPPQFFLEREEKVGMRQFGYPEGTLGLTDRNDILPPHRLKTRIDRKQILILSARDL